MKLKRSLALAMMALVCMTVSAISKPRTVYVFGFASSFNDSTVYFTDVQQLDSAYIEPHTRFLYGRSEYSNQLQRYLASIGFGDATCVTSFALTPAEANKKYFKLRKKYLSNGHNTVKTIKQPEFRYLPVEETVSGN